MRKKSDPCKTVKQNINISDPKVLELMNIFKLMANECLRIGVKHKKGKKYPNANELHLLCYRNFAEKYRIHTEYIGSVFRRVGIMLKNMEHAEKRGKRPKTPFLKEGYLISSHSTSFKIKDGSISIPIGGATERGKFFEIKLSQYILDKIVDMNVRSFNISRNQLCISYRNKEAHSPILPRHIVGIDRNLDCITLGNEELGVEKIPLKKPKMVVENTRKIVKSFRRDDNRVRNNLKRKYGSRQTNRVNSELHKTTNYIIDKSKRNVYMLVMEDIKHVRDKHTRKNNKIKSVRSSLNSWSFGEVQRQIDYKSIWNGVPLKYLTKEQTMYTSTTCHKCGELVAYDRKTRLCCCKKCNLEVDRDVLGTYNIAERGR